MIGNSAPVRWRGGELFVGGISADELAMAYGTPVLALDYDVFDAAIAQFLQACAPHSIEVAYAGKALLLVALARHLKHTPLHLDVCSIGELATAERAAFPPSRIAFHGCGKTGEELDAAAVLVGHGSGEARVLVGVDGDGQLGPGTGGTAGVGGTGGAGDPDPNRRPVRRIVAAGQRW